MEITEINNLIDNLVSLGLVKPDPLFDDLFFHDCEDMDGGCFKCVQYESCSQASQE